MTQIRVVPGMGRSEADFMAGDDKFSQINVDYLPDQITWKLYRAKQHLMEFERVAGAYMNVEPYGPGRMIHAPESSPEVPMFVYAAEEPVPARFGLIAGDYLQNLRSVLDYLVWQLILANGQTPHKTNTAFPICSSRKSFEDATKRRLVGVPQGAIDLIERLQPYPVRNPSNHPQTISILDELTNHNKHRQVLFTALGSIFKTDDPAPFPHIELEVTRNLGGNLVVGERLLAYIAFQDGIAKGLEVTATLSALMDWMGFEVLPRFKQFF